MQTFVAAIRGLYRPEQTLLITELGNPRSYPWLRHAMFYLPEYPIYELRVGPLPPGFYAPRLATAMSRTLVDHWSPVSERPVGLEEVELPYGRCLYVLPLGPTPVTWAGYTFVRDGPPRRARAAH